ncbi:MAG: biotin--[acetyl-CoA-carboxylase] ligase [Deltaproteobacteria bacterium]|nr:biotin--[acetyl-CoA-carboxylase] ligase [Deltaproteobacteria bacterium]
MIEPFVTPWGSRLQSFTRLDSTSRYLWRQGEAGAESGQVAVAAAQTAGCGRRGRSWHSPPGLNLYFSILLRPGLDFAKVPQLSLVVGAALWRALAHELSRLTIKWPNDLFCTDRKLAGVLAEMKPGPSRPEFVVLGIGLNVNAGLFDYPEALRPLVTSLRMETGAEYDLGALLQRLLVEIADCERIYRQEGLGLQLGALINRNFYLAGRDVVLLSGEQRHGGRARAIDACGRLLVSGRDGKTRCFSAGEVQLEKQPYNFSG